ncbi:MAG: sulfurtransferase [Planctomycetota bacterium]
MYQTLISVDELIENIEDPNWVIVDCRFSLADPDSGRNDYRMSHVPNAYYAHLDDALSGEIVPGSTGRHPLPTIEAAEATFSSWGIDSKTQVVVYDQGHGGIAARLWWMLNWLGHSKVAVLDGGWAQWIENSGPVTSEPPEYATQIQFTAAPNPDLWIDVSEVEAICRSGNSLLIDSRTSPRYQGLEEPIDPVAGHIPGAVNSPFVDNLLNGKFDSAESLKARFENVLGDFNPDQTIFYCGSGVTACHNVLAVKHAGLGMAKIFPGSWSQWVADPKRSISTSD